MCESESEDEDSELLDICLLCDKPVKTGDKVIPGINALETIKRCSKERRDGKHKRISGNCIVIVHRYCRNDYTKPSSVQKEKRQYEKMSSEQSVLSPKKRLRSQGLFDYESTCFFCEESIPDFQKKKTGKIRKVLDSAFQDKVKMYAESRNDKTGRQVISRICSVDLKAVGAAYHRNCWATFRRDNIHSAPGRTPSEEIFEGMKLVYDYLEGNDDCQFSLKELFKVSGLQGKCSELTMKTKLIEHFGDRIIITCTQNRVPVVCFRNRSEKIIYDRWYDERMKSEEEEELRIMKKAGEIVRKHVESAVYENTSYPSASCFFDDVHEFIPKPLQVFMEIVTSKRNQNQNNALKRKTDVLSHCLIALVKPRSFMSPIMLGIGSYIHQNIGSKTLINLLSNLGLCSSYHDVSVLETSVVMSPEPKIKPGSFVQFAFDNCDFNVNTIDGSGTFHNMAGIKCVTPANSIVNSKDRIPKETRLRHSQLVEKKGILQVKPVDFQMIQGLRQLEFSNLNAFFPPKMYIDTPSPYDVVWMLGKYWSIEGFPGWQGFIENVTRSDYSDNSSIVTMPFIMAPPSDLDTVHTALLIAADAGVRGGVGRIVVTFDLPLYMKALEIVLAAPPHSPLQKVVPRIGGFHLTMSFLGCIGYIMADSGLQELLSIVYAENTTKHILSGHAYARAVRAHNLVATALSNLILSEVVINDEEKSAVLNVLNTFNDFPPDRASIMSDTTVLNLTFKLREEMEKIKNRGATAKLWVQYLEMVTLVRHFIEAERTGNWELHLNTIKLMLPYFVASGHYHYGKACYIYLQQMSHLSQEMTDLEFKRYSSGYFTIRRKNKFCSGTSPDMVIEQTANREFKVTGGIVKRGFTDEVLSSYVLRKPAMALITASMEDFSGITFISSEQHVDARDSRIKRDDGDIQKLQERLEMRNPFLNTSSVVVSLGTGITGNDFINCHMAKEVGENVLAQLIGKRFMDIKMKRSDNVRSLATATTSVKVKEKCIAIEPMIMYQRLLFVKKENDDLSTYFKYELSPYPLALFTNSGMRKTVKAALYDEFCTIDDEELKKTEYYVIDGGYLLHVLRWKKVGCLTYLDVCNAYAKYLHINFKTDRKLVVFDGYSDSNSIKESEHQRRNKHFSPKFNITESSMVFGNQESFLANSENKKQLIEMVSAVLRNEGVEVKQCVGDADVEIVQTAVEISEKFSTTIVTQDVDVLVLMIAYALPDKPILLLKPPIGRVKRKVFSSLTLQQEHVNVKEYILLVHSFSGCDSTSAIYGKGKKQLLKLVEKNNLLMECVSIFNSHRSTANEIEKAGERLFLSLYGTTHSNISLNELRYNLFQKSLKKIAPKLESLPPTSASGAQHSFRTYYQVQVWQGNKGLVPEEWGWMRQDHILQPVKTTLEPAPDNILKLISCACKGSCSTQQCTCLKSGIKCSTICKVCEGTSCMNNYNESEVSSASYDKSQIVHFDEHDGGSDIETVNGENTVY